MVAPEGDEGPFREDGRDQSWYPGTFKTLRLILTGCTDPTDLPTLGIVRRAQREGVLRLAQEQAFAWLSSADPRDLPLDRDFRLSHPFAPKKGSL